MNDETKKIICDYLYEQAKKCQTAAGGGLLLSLKNHLCHNSPTYEGCDELWQVADHLCQQGIDVVSVAGISSADLEDEVNTALIGIYPVHIHHLHENADSIEEADEPVFLEAVEK